MFEIDIFAVFEVNSSSRHLCPDVDNIVRYFIKVNQKSLS